MVRTLEIKASSKINLGLEVAGKREDGYHDIVTIFQEIALFDKLTLTLTDKGISLWVDDSTLPVDKRNLAFQAAQLFLEKQPQLGGVKIKLYKNIPYGAGLGGGSSDAAAVLKGLNQLSGLPYDSEALMEMAVKIGTDVPFFLSGGTAYATGRGEILEFLPLDWQPGIIIVKPAASLSTALMYHSLKLGLTNKVENIRMLRQILLEKRYSEIGDFFYNRFEEMAFVLCPETRIIKERLLEAGCQAALLCGSGSAVFGLSESVITAKKIQRKWEGKEKVFITVVKTINR